MPQFKLCLLVFGGTDLDTGLILVLESAFEIGFGREECNASWRKIGAAPLTQACLKDPIVRTSIGEGNNEYALLLCSIQEVNEYTVYALNEGGYDGSALQALLRL